MQRSRKQKLHSALVSIFLTILVLIPFNAFITSWIGSHSSHYRAIQLWPELVLVFITLALIFVTSVDAYKSIFKYYKVLILLIIAYFIFTLTYGLIAFTSHSVNLSALIFSFVTNLRLPAILLISLVLFYTYDRTVKWVKLILIPGLITIIFGISQLFLPPYFLAHFGYSKYTILPIQFVNDKSKFVRIQSTLRGANPFGAYLTIIVTAFLACLMYTKKNKKLLTIMSALAIIALFATYSRSAIIGTVLSSIMLLWWHAKIFEKPRVKKIALLAVSVIIFLFFCISFVIRKNHTVQELILHTDSSSQSQETSNEVRFESLKSGLKDIKSQPFGRGPGTAGPASVHNNHPARIAENYYIQLAQELGIIGLILFVSINIYVAYKLWEARNEPLSLLLLTSLVGISFINLLSHAWTDETLAYIWWGLAGLSLSVILNKERKKTTCLNSNEKKPAK